MVVIEREEAANLLTTSTPDELRERRLKMRKGRESEILRDTWLAPLTLVEDAQIGNQGTPKQ